MILLSLQGMSCTARAARLMILDIKPLLRAINERDKQASDEAMGVLQTKINVKQAYLHTLNSQLSDLRQLV